jgi:hypothetical protein
MRLSHPEFGVDLNPKSEAAIAAFSGEDISVASVEIRCGGVIRQSIYAATSPRDDARNCLSPYLFDEERDGIVRATVPVGTTGYWSYDPETKSLVNQKSDQKIQFVGHHPRDEAVASGLVRHGQSWRFIYRDSETEYPVLVRSEVTSRDFGLCRRWHIDHVASASLWRNQREGPVVPPYGLWRRVDSCALDAFLCWRPGSKDS